MVFDIKVHYPDIFTCTCLILSICYWFYSPPTQQWGHEEFFPPAPSAHPQVMPISSIGPNGAISGEWMFCGWLVLGWAGGIMVMEWWTPYTLCSELRPARHGCHSARAVNGTPRSFTVRGEGPIYELLKLLSIAFNIDNLLRHYDKAVFKHSTARSAEVEPPRTWLKVR